MYIQILTTNELFAIHFLNIFYKHEFGYMKSFSRIPMKSNHENQWYILKNQTIPFLYSKSCGRTPNTMFTCEVRCNKWLGLL